MVKRYYIQDYPEYSGSVLDGLRIASKIMSSTFRSITQSKNAQSAERGERENRAQTQSWKQIQFSEEEIKDLKDSYSYHKIS